jgi:hypothetical protein
VDGIGDEMKRKLTKAVITIQELKDGRFKLYVKFIPRAPAGALHPAGQIAIEAVRHVAEMSRQENP